MRSERSSENSTEWRPERNFRSCWIGNTLPRRLPLFCKARLFFVNEAVPNQDSVFGMKSTSVFFWSPPLRTFFALHADGLQGEDNLLPLAVLSLTDEYSISPLLLHSVKAR